MGQYWKVLDGLGYLLLMLGPLLFAQRWLHREIQLVFFILARRQTVALGLFSFLFFPGVLLHELSHYLTARLLGVRTGRLSLFPSLMPGGKLRLGYVETAQADILREALIGAAPLIAGGAAVAYLGVWQLGLAPLAGMAAQGDWPELLQTLGALPAQPDFWLWFFLAFTISSTMLPSASDRRAWLPVSIVALTLAGAAILAGAGPWMLENIAPWLNQALRSVAAVFGISLALHLILLLPAWLLRLLLMRVMGVRLVEEGG